MGPSKRVLTVLTPVALIGCMGFQPVAGRVIANRRVKTEMAGTEIAERMECGES